MKTTKEKVEIMNAWLNGSDVQVYDSTYDNWDDVDIKDPQWNWGMNDYRIKPQPKTRTMNFEELVNVAYKGCLDKHGRWHPISGVSQLKIAVHYNESETLTHDEFAEVYTQPNGEPFTVEVE